MRALIELDERAAAAVAGWRPGRLARLFAALSHSGAGVVWATVATLLSVLSIAGVEPIPDQRAVLAGTMSAGLSLLVGQLIKRIVRRQRPYERHPDRPPHIRPPTDPSFPSTHTSTAVALAVALALAGHPWTALVAVWALGVAGSRIAVGVHYPGDVLGGVALGVICGLIQMRPLLDALLAAVPR